VLTAIWQTLLDDGNTVIPIIFISDATHLTNFSGAKKAWTLLYMTIGNQSASTYMVMAMYSMLLVALLPIAIKIRNIPISRYNEQKEYNRMILQHVLRHGYLGTFHVCGSMGILRLMYGWPLQTLRCFASYLDC
jgi:hypothetical protein